MSTQRPALVRPRDSLLSGVSVALATHLGWPVGVVRLLFVVTTFLWGAGALLYLWLWALTPLATAEDQEAPVRRSIPVAVVLLAIGTVLALAIGAVWSPMAVTVLLGITILLAAGALAWNLRFDTTDPRRQGRYAELVRFWAAGLLLFAVIVTLLGPVEPDAGVIIVAAFAILVAAGILIAPWAIGRWRDAMQTRADAIREQHRAEVAAHLHDSVLQSLALIQNRAGASTEIARIARAQERELRDWLYTGSAAVDNDLATELREIASDLELEYAVAFDVVTAGDSAELVSSELVAAAKEAMVNAARHAGGEVSVYLEASDRRVDVWVRDRGPGFDPTAVPTSRLGVRESIVGRMARAGGSATVGPGSGGAGTQVHLQLERTGAPR